MYTDEEKLEHAKTWIEALESGRYKQGKRYLRPEPDVFCCLGVACEVSGLSNFKLDDSYHANYLNRSAYMANPVIDYYPNSINQYRLATLNDEGKTFPEIAKAIRNMVGL